MDKFFSCDWGTSNFRLRLVDGETMQVLASIETADGIASTFTAWQRSGSRREDFYGNILHQALEELAKTAGINKKNVPVIISGMASSSLGLIELPYTTLPIDQKGFSQVVVTIKELPNVYIIPGVRSANDVMRGEETQWMGLMQDQRFASAESLLCILPGTHSKHIIVENGTLVHFHTYMTGEFFQVLSNHSVLKNSIGLEKSMQTQEQQVAFAEGVRASARGSLLNQAFMVRTNQLLGRFSSDANGFFLSGLLIGSELQHLDAPEIVIAAKKDLATLYQIALHTLSYNGRVHLVTGDEFDNAIIKGQFVIFNRNTSIDE